MFEQIGLANHASYFSTINRLLKPDGIYLHHAITKRMKRDGRTRKSPEYEALVKYIFPGGEVDAIGMTLGSLETHGFYVHDVENLREHYARTCRLWAERLKARFDEAIAEVGEPKARLWLLYLDRLLDRLRARLGADLPDRGDKAEARPQRVAADPRRSLPLQLKRYLSPFCSAGWR